MYSKRTFALGLLVFCLISQLAVSQHYTVTDLGPLFPTAINTWGQVVGNVNGHAFVWTKTRGLRDLGTLPGGTYSSATGINDLGAVTGTADGFGTVISLDSDHPNRECSDLIQPFVWTQRSGMQGLGTIGAPDLPDFQWCALPFYAADINVVSQVVGYTQEYTNNYQWGFLWTRTSGMALFGDSWPPTFANKVSNTGKIVGQNSDNMTFGRGHATWWKDGVMTDLGTLGGGADVTDYASSANGVNDLGQVVGWSTTTPIPRFRAGCLDNGADCVVHAVLWTSGGAIRDLETLPGDTFSAALKINFSGQIVGVSGTKIVLHWSGDTYSLEVSGRPFVWSERSGMRDLNTLIRGNSKWVLTSATDINVWGQIVGQGMLNGHPHGFLLTPRAFFGF